MQLHEACLAIVDCEHKTAPTASEGYPSIRTPNIGPGYFILDGVNRVSRETYEAWTRRMKPQPGDLIMAREAPVGNVAMIPEGMEPCLGQRTLLIRPNPSAVDSRYLVFLLVSPEIQQQIHGKTNGATVAHLNMGDVRKLSLPTLPPLPTQRRIAAILSAYDDLIENNRKRIAILEDMARRLYREWFVHFRYPGHESVPLVDSPLGRIPQGWACPTVGELFCEHIGGGWGSDIEEGDFTEAAYVIRGTDIPGARHCQIDDVPLRFHKPSNLASRSLAVGDIVFEVSGGSKGQPVGRPLYVSQELLESLGKLPVMCASFCKKVRLVDGATSKIIYFSMLDGYENGEVMKYQIQSTGISNFNWSAYMSNVMRVHPDQSTREQFERVTDPIFSLIGNMGRQITVLRRTRDLLLPRLMSGTLSVEALATAEAAVP